MKMSRAGSTRPDMHSTPSAPFGTLQPSPCAIRSESSTPTSSVSYCMVPKHGELSSQTSISCRPSSTDASETSSTSDGQTSFPTPTSRTRLVRALLKWRSVKGNGGGSGTHSGSSPQTTPSKPLTGIHKESEKWEDRNRLGAGVLTQR